MKKILFFLLFLSTFTFAQSNLEIIQIIINNHQYFEGKKSEKNNQIQSLAIIGILESNRGNNIDLAVFPWNKIGIQERIGTGIW